MLATSGKLANHRPAIITVRNRHVNLILTSGADGVGTQEGRSNVVTNQITPLKTQFRSEEASATERAARWEEYLNRELTSKALVTPLHKRPMEAVGAGVRGKDAKFAHLAGSPQVAVRGQIQREEAPCEFVCFEVVLHGMGLFKDANAVHMVRAGQGIIYDANTAYSFAFERGMRQRVLMLSHELLDPSTIPVLPRVVSFQQPGTVGHALADVIRDALRHPGDVAGAERDAQSLLSGVLPQGQCSLASYRLLALDLLRSRFSDHGLDGESVANTLGISERHLRRAFAEEEGGVGRALLRVRLEVAAALLVDPGLVSLSIADVAVRCGVSSQSFFSREFKRKYGMTPREYRRQVAHQAS